MPQPGQRVDDGRARVLVDRVLFERRVARRRPQAPAPRRRGRTRGTPRAPATSPAGTPGAPARSRGTPPTEANRIASRSAVGPSTSWIDLVGRRARRARRAAARRRRARAATPARDTGRRARAPTNAPIECPTTTARSTPSASSTATRSSRVRGEPGRPFEVVAATATAQIGSDHRARRAGARRPAATTGGMPSPRGSAAPSARHPASVGLPHADAQVAARRTGDVDRAIRRRHRAVHPPSIVYEAPVTMPALSETSQPPARRPRRPRRGA